MSVISVWEIGILHARGRIALSLEIDDWVERALAGPGVRLAQITPAIALDGTRLAGNPAGDPADRILMATARALDARLVTRDRRILEYAQRGFISALDASP